MMRKKFALGTKPKGLGRLNEGREGREGRNEGLTLDKAKKANEEIKLDRFKKKRKEQRFNRSSSIGCTFIGTTGS